MSVNLIMNYIKYTVYCIWWFLSFESLDLGTEANIFLKFNLNPYTCANHVKISKICGALSLTFLESVFKSAQINLMKSGFKKKYSSSLNHKCIAYRFGYVVWVHKQPHEIGCIHIREASLNMKWSCYQSWSNGSASLLKLTTCIYPVSLSKLGTCHEEDIYDIQACSNPSIKHILKKRRFLRYRRTHRH